MAVLAKIALCFFAFSLILGTAFAGASLTVNVRNTQDSVPISGALVNVYDSNSGALLGSGYTNAGGIKNFPDLPAGNLLKVTIEKSGYSTSTSAYLPANNLNLRMDVNASSSQSLGSLMVIVKDPGSLGAIASATVTVANNDYSQSASTDASGSALFNLPIGTYTITTAKEGYSASSKTTSVTTSTTETLYPGQIPSQALDQNASLTVFVKDSNSLNPLAGATVTATRADGNYSRTSSTNSSGSAFFGGMPLGTYNITATRSGYNPNSRSLSLTSDASTTLYLTAIPQDLNASLGVFVYDASTGAFIAGATVTATKTGFSQSASTYTSGGINYPANFSSIPKGDYLLSASKTGYYTNTKNLSLTANSETTISLTKVPEAHYMSVTVYDDQGATVYGAKVGVLKTNDPNARSVSKLTDSLGMAVFNELENADYLVSVMKTGYNSNQTTAHSDTNISITITQIIMEDVPEVYVSGVDFGNSTPKLVNVNGRKVYQITGIKTGMLFMIIPIKMDVKVLVDPETKKPIQVEPWWSFLVGKK